MSLKIGVFDSGVGGLHVTNTFQAALPKCTFIYKDDSAHLPYGTKTPEQLHSLVLPILQELVSEGCEIIVIACNTVTTTLIKQLRSELPVPLIGFEPMVKSAAELTKSKVITVCATPTTLASHRYKWLKDNYANGLLVIEPDCSDWTRMIEANHIDRDHIWQRIDDACKRGADVIVLGCTHYHWIMNIINDVANGRATVIHPEKAVIEQLKRIMALKNNP